MFNWLKKTFGKAAPAPQAANAKRNFAAAQINRLLAVNRQNGFMTKTLDQVGKNDAVAWIVFCYQ